MTSIPLYRYIRPDGGVTVSPRKPSVDYTELTRLVADEGYVLTDGVVIACCIDTDGPDMFYEILDSENPNEATAEDYQNALREMGVEV